MVSQLFKHLASSNALALPPKWGFWNKRQSYIQTQQRDFKANGLPAFLGESRVHAYGLGAPSILNYHRDSDLQVIHAESTLLGLYRALAFLKVLNKKNQRSLKVLFLNTNPELSNIVQNSARFCQQYYINTKWVGGTLTNWKQVSKSIKAFHALQRKWRGLLTDKSLSFPQLEKMKKCFSGYLNEKGNLKIALHRKEHLLNSLFSKQDSSDKRITLIRNQLTQFFLVTSEKSVSVGGIGLKNPTLLSKEASNFSSQKLDKQQTLALVRKGSNRIKTGIEKPDVIIVIDPYNQQIAIEEAIVENIPVIAFVNSDTPISGITYAIPGNNQNHEYIHFCLDWIARVLRF